VVATLEVRLVLVGNEQRGCAEIAVTGDERPAPVRTGVAGHHVVTHREVNAVLGGLDAPVAGVGLHAYDLAFLPGARSTTPVDDSAEMDHS